MRQQALVAVFDIVRLLVAWDVHRAWERHRSPKTLRRNYLCKSRAKRGFFFVPQTDRLAIQASGFVGFGGLCGRERVHVLPLSHRSGIPFA